MKQARNIVWAAAIAAALAGCKRSGSGTVIVQDPGPARYAEAVRLADQASAAYKAGKTDRAIELYQQSLQHSQELAIVWHNLGMLYLDRGDRMQAVEMLKNAADLEPSRPTPYYNIGLIYGDNAQPDKAMEYFRKSLERDKLYLPSLRGAAKMGRMLVVSDDEALERMKTALLVEKDPAWRKIFEEEKLRIDGALQAAGRTGKF